MKLLAASAVVVIIVIVVLAAGMGQLFTAREEEPETGTGDKTTEPAPTDGVDGTPKDQYPLIEEAKITYTRVPMNEIDYIEIAPLGNLNPPGHTFPTDHIYFYFADPWAYPPPYQVMVPADGTITEISYYQYDWPAESGRSGKFDDYSVTIAHTDTFSTKLGHISELEDWILGQAGVLKPDWNRLQEPIPVKAGDVIGRTGGRPGYLFAFDMWTLDETVTLSFIHPEKYGNAVHAVSPFEYFEENLRAFLYQRVRRTAEPRGGKINFDQLGKLVGNWFLEGIADPLRDWEKHLAFVYGRDDPSQVRISVGGTLSITAGVYAVEGNSPDPAQVSAENGIVVYRVSGVQRGTSAATILAQVVGSERIKVEAFEGSPINPEFTANALYYTR